MAFREEDFILHLALMLAILDFMSPLFWFESWKHQSISGKINPWHNHVLA
jgi:hypothetical protein